MSRERALIYYVEDDENIRNLAVYALEQAGFATRGCSQAREFFTACSDEIPDLILLDIMLPEVDGIEILKQVRQNPALASLPVMMLTAKGTEFDAVSGLNAGADDYLAKPFGMMELIARVNALLRRVQEREAPTHSTELKGGGFVLNTAAHSVLVNDQVLVLTLKEFDLLKILMQNKGVVLSRDQLLRSVWGVEYLTGSETRTVDVHVQTLRQKITESAPGAEAHIHTVRGVGYCFKDAPAENC